MSTWPTPDFHQNATIVVALVDGAPDAVENIDKLWDFDKRLTDPRDPPHVNCHRRILCWVLQVLHIYDKVLAALRAFGSNESCPNLFPLVTMTIEASELIALASSC